VTAAEPTVERAVISVLGLSVRYAETDVVHDISFDVHRGEVFALLGPNGAGKTTTVEVLEGHRRRRAGSVEVLGFDPYRGGRAFRERIGIVLQEAGLDGELMVREALALFAALYPHPRDIDEVVSLVQLEAKGRERVRTLSGGQRRRLDLALGLIGDPDVLFLDEPTTGFDPAARRQAWDVLDDLRRLGKTIVLTSHYMDEVQRLADRVAVLMDGHIVAINAPSSLGGRDRAKAEIRFRLPAPLGISDLPAGLAGLAETDDAGIVLRADHPTSVLATLTGWALERGDELEALTVTRPSLEDILLDLTRPADTDTDTDIAAP
jgi:ABC-2 type transport system ATP-binding protein